MANCYFLTIDLTLKYFYDKIAIFIDFFIFIVNIEKDTINFYFMFGLYSLLVISSIKEVFLKILDIILFLNLRMLFF